MTPVGSSAPAAPPLQRLDERGAQRGFANLLRKELATWTRTRSGWVQLLLWLGILNGLMTLPLVFMRDMFAGEMGSPLAAAMDMYFNLGALAPYAGVVIMTHGAIIAERQLGTAAWVLSKPIARSAFILAKFVAFGLALVVLALALPGIVAYAALSLEAGAPLAAARFAAGVGILALGLLWYLALTLMLGTLTSARGVVLAVPLVLLVVGDMLIMLWPTVAELGPWVLGRMAMLVADGGPLLSPWPLLSTALGTGAFLAIALWRFRREEF